jgi:hypothetical protein
MIEEDLDMHKRERGIASPMKTPGARNLIICIAVSIVPSTSHF